MWSETANPNNLKGAGRDRVAHTPLRNPAAAASLTAPTVPAAAAAAIAASAALSRFVRPSAELREFAHRLLRLHRVHEMISREKVWIGPPARPPCRVRPTGRLAPSSRVTATACKPFRKALRKAKRSGFSCRAMDERARRWQQCAQNSSLLPARWYIGDTLRKLDPRWEMCSRRWITSARGLDSVCRLEWFSCR
jgi:hypothetical protein